MTTWNGIKDWAYAERVTDSDLNGYVSDNTEFLFWEIPANHFGAANAILPSSNAATAAQFESTVAATDYAPNWSELVFSGIAANLAQWNFKSWFAASDATGLKFRAYTTDVTASTDDVDIIVGIAAVSVGDGSINTKSFAHWTTATVDAATLEDAAFTFKTYTIASTGASDWGGLTYADFVTVQLQRVGSDDDLPLDLHVERVWFY